MGVLDPNNPNIIVTEAFGLSAGGSYITLPIPVPSQIGVAANIASFTDGFPPNTMTAEASGGLPPRGQDMNGLLYMLSANVAALTSGYIPTFSSTRATGISGYTEGSIALNQNLNGFWINGAANNVNDPDSGGAGWLPLATAGGIAVALAATNVTLTAPQAAYPLIVFTGTLTANVTVTFPNWEGTGWTLVNGTVGAFTVTARGSGAGVLVPQTGFGAPTTVYCDGANNLFPTGISTAGLAPLNSPTFTGTPAGPNASSGTNTTQLATTAFTQAAIAAALSGFAPLASPTFSGVPTAPTPATSDNSVKIATTAFARSLVALLVPASRAGSFNCTNGTVSVTFSSVMPAIPVVVVSPAYASPDVGFIVPGSISTSGFQYTNGNAGLCNYMAQVPH